MPPQDAPSENGASLNVSIPIGRHVVLTEDVIEEVARLAADGARSYLRQWTAEHGSAVPSLTELPSTEQQSVVTKWAPRRVDGRP